MNMDIRSGSVRFFFRIITLLCVVGFPLQRSAAETVFSDNSPFATTQPSWWLDGNTAALNGMVTPRSSSTTVWFEWGTNDPYEHRTDPVILNPTESVVAIRAPISGLTNGIVYHSRLVASNLAGIALGADQQFGIGKTVTLWNHFGEFQTNLPRSLSNIVAIAAVWQEQVVLTVGGNVLAWSDIGSAITNLPTDLNDAVAIGAGYAHGIALRS